MWVTHNLLARCVGLCRILGAIWFCQWIKRKFGNSNGVKWATTTVGLIGVHLVYCIQRRWRMGFVCYTCCKFRTTSSLDISCVWWCIVRWCRGDDCRALWHCFGSRKWKFLHRDLRWLVRDRSRWAGCKRIPSWRSNCHWRWVWVKIYKFLRCTGCVCDRIVMEKCTLDLGREKFVCCTWVSSWPSRSICHSVFRPCIPIPETSRFLGWPFFPNSMRWLHKRSYRDIQAGWRMIF